MDLGPGVLEKYIGDIYWCVTGPPALFLKCSPQIEVDSPHGLNLRLYPLHFFHL